MHRAAAFAILGACSSAAAFATLGACSSAAVFAILGACSSAGSEPRDPAATPVPVSAHVSAASIDAASVGAASVGSASAGASTNLGIGSGAGSSAASAEDGKPLPCPLPTRVLERGLAYERWRLDAAPLAGGSVACVDVVRAELARYRLRAMLSNDDPPHTAPEWRDIFHLAAVTNAGMFHDDNHPVGLIVADGTAHGADNAKMSGYLAFDPRSAADPPVVVAGRDCPGFDLDALKARYRSIVQSYRLLGCTGEAIAWQDPKHYSAAAIAIGRDGRIVFLHVRAALTMAELSAGLATHDLAGALFLEGGPEASLVAGTDPARDVRAMGSYETGFLETDDNRAFWKLPNIIALVAR